MKSIQNQVLLNPEDKTTILKASKFLGIGFATFIRMSALAKARSVIEENKLEEKL